MSDRVMYAGLAAIIAVAGLIAWRVAEPRQLVTEANNGDVLAAMATEIKAANLALTPTSTPYHSPTPRPTEKPPTETPLPTWYPEASPLGLYLHRVTATPLPTTVLDFPECKFVTPTTDPVVCRVAVQRGGDDVR